ncbi:MAG TPA: gamma-glutamyltransferase [Geminicoccaceae bacterium]|nr:gamma-glutamyltransferase [Geminicoccaceae bacterium]
MFTTRPEIKGTFGVAASTHWLASATAMGVLERGGNAFDAAAAGGFVLQVVEPHLNGPGGEVPILVWDRRGRRIEVICGQGVAPAAATTERFRELGLDLVPGTGLLPACVPGAFGAWLLLLRDHGTWPLADVLAPAVAYAEGGFPLVPRITNALAAVEALFRDDWPSSAEIYLRRTGLPRPEDLFRNPALAGSYRRVVGEAEAAGGDRERQIEAARRAWYEGFVADAIDRFYRTAELRDSSGGRHGGLLTGDDMARWRATSEAPVTYDYHGYTVAKCGPWSQGPVLLQQLALLEGLPLDGMPPDGPDFVHTVVEAAKLAFADREAWYGDPDGFDVPLGALLSGAYNAERRGLIGATARTELRPGSPDGRPPRLPRYRIAEPDGTDINTMLGVGEPTTAAAHAGEPATEASGAMRGDTCHIDVIDRWGNMVAATPSGGWFQSSPVVPGLGFSLSTRAQMFWLREGLAGTLAPGRRPRTTLTPSMALRDGEPYLAWGTPGGDQQDQWSLLLFLHHVHHGLNLQEAIDAPAFHSEHWPSSFWPREARPNVLVLEGRFPEETVEGLGRRGHGVTVGEPWSEGRLSACSQRDHDGTRYLRAAANPRGMQGYAVGR